MPVRFDSFFKLDRKLMLHFSLVVLVSPLGAPHGGSRWPIFAGTALHVCGAGLVLQIAGAEACLVRRALWRTRRAFGSSRLIAAGETGPDYLEAEEALLPRLPPHPSCGYRVELACWFYWWDKRGALLLRREFARSCCEFVYAPRDQRMPRTRMS